MSRNKYKKPEDEPQDQPESGNDTIPANEPDLDRPASRIDPLATMESQPARPDWMADIVPGTKPVQGKMEMILPGDGERLAAGWGDKPSPPDTRDAEIEALKAQVAALEQRLVVPVIPEPEIRSFEVTFRAGNLKPAARALRTRTVAARTTEEAKTKYIAETTAAIAVLPYASRDEILQGFQNSLSTATFDVKDVAKERELADAKLAAMRVEKAKAG